jgi:hypothetical protein
MREPLRALERGIGGSGDHRIGVGIFVANDIDRFRHGCSFLCSKDQKRMPGQGRGGRWPDRFVVSVGIGRCRRAWRSAEYEHAFSAGEIDAPVDFLIPGEEVIDIADAKVASLYTEFLSFQPPVPVDELLRECFFAELTG